MLAGAHPVDADSGSPLHSEWQALYEALVIGITHAMNNAVAVMGLSLELAQPDEVPTDLAALRGEVSRVEKLVALLATLSTHSPRDEALELRAVVDVAIATHALKPATRFAACRLHVAGEMPPVRVPRSSLLRALLLMLDSAMGTADRAGAVVDIEMIGTSDYALIRAPVSREPDAAAMSYAAECGGTLTVRDGCQVFELPSLQRLRASSRAN